MLDLLGHCLEDGALFNEVDNNTNHLVNNNVNDLIEREVLNDMRQLNDVDIEARGADRRVEYNDMPNKMLN